MSKGCSTRIPLSACYTSVVVVKGRGLLQGIQVLDTWDTALVEKVEGVSEVLDKYIFLGLAVLIFRFDWKDLSRAATHSWWSAVLEAGFDFFFQFPQILIIFMLYVIVK